MLNTSTFHLRNIVSSQYQDYVWTQTMIPFIGKDEKLRIASLEYYKEDGEWKNKLVEIIIDLDD